MTPSLMTHHLKAHEKTHHPFSLLYHLSALNAIFARILLLLLYKAKIKINFSGSGHTRKRITGCIVAIINAVV